MNTLRIFVSRVIGAWLGRKLAEHQRCYRCGAPCRTGGGFDCPIQYSREFCSNRPCVNYVPF